VTPSDVVVVAALLTVVVVPLAAVVCVALLRSYTISLHMKRRRPGDDDA
jgi:hypothetical protein